MSNVKIVITGKFESAREIFRGSPEVKNPKKPSRIKGRLITQLKKLKLLQNQ